jgi:hypothetical protein
MEPKVQHEMALATLFVEWLRARGSNLGTPVPGDPNANQPDVVCPDAATGVEVTAGYYDKTNHARNLWAAVRGKPFDRTGGAINPDSSLGQSLNSQLLRKCSDRSVKPYSTPTHLLLDATLAPLTTADDAESVINEIKVPQRHPFVSICLAFNAMGRGDKVFMEIGMRQREP